MKELAEMREQISSLDAVAQTLSETRELLGLFADDPTAEHEADRSIESRGGEDRGAGDGGQL